MPETPLPAPEEYEEAFAHHTDAAVMVSFGQVHPGREGMAVEAFLEISRCLGKLLADDVITSFKPFFFADGTQGDVSGFFLLEGTRERLDALRREQEFVRMVVRAGAAVQNLRVHTLVAGSEAGRLVNLFREIRSDLGLI